MSRFHDSVEEELSALTARELRRSSSDELLRRTVEASAHRRGASLIDASSNDYLGFAGETVSRETLSDAPGGAGASRLIHGSRDEHRSSERALAEFCGQSRSLLFSSGYAANVGAIPALAGDGDLIVSDELNHASIIDGARLSRATVRIAQHADLDSFQRHLADASQFRRALVVTEAYFSMDGDTPDLRGLRRACDASGAGLYVDEAHSLGTFGQAGCGLCAMNDVRADVVVGTLGKAVGLQGAFVGCAEATRELLWNRARSFVFSTAVSPLLAQLIQARIVEVADAEDRRARLRSAEVQLEALLGAARVGLAKTRTGPVFPIVFGDSSSTLAAAERVRSEGILVQAIRPPTVPDGTARLRVTVNAGMGALEVERLAEALAKAYQALAT